MRILVTGSAGFIGSDLSMKLLERGEKVIGVDNHNDYYDPVLKEARLTRHLEHENYTHLRLDISNQEAVKEVFFQYKPQRVVNLAAQAGVRHSIDQPHSFVQSNIVGFMNVLEECRHHQVEHLVYASSSSVYGANTTLPFSVHHNVDHPVSLYAASKKSNELMAHTYSYLYGFPTTGLRFFTVYGPWGRPDMALFKFTKAIISGEPIKVFNYGKHRRDFTYIDDVIESVIKIIYRPARTDPNWSSGAPQPGTSSAPWRLYNIGNNKSIELMDFIHTLEESIGLKARIEMLPLQPGDVPDTYADINAFLTEIDYRPNTTIQHGIKNFVNWYRNYYGV